MDEQTSARIGAIEERITVVETEVAVIQSNYVRKDQHAERHSDLRDDIAAMRLENREAHAKNRALIAQVSAENQAAIAQVLAALAKVSTDNQAAIAKVSAENQAAIARISADNQAAIAKVSAENQAGIAQVSAENKQTRVHADNLAAGLSADINKMGMTILMWMFVMLIGFAGLLLAVIREIR